MKDIYEVLQQKEADIAQVRKQIENLQIVSLLFCNESNWKDAYECLHHKEDELARVRHEVESLQIVAPLLAEEVPFDEENQPATSIQGVRPSVSEATGTDGLYSSVSASRGPKFWRILKRKT
jgi:hypothetical protein